MDTFLLGRCEVSNHSEDQFFRHVCQDLCKYAEMQHLRASPLASPGTTPQVCPVDSIVNTHPVRQLVSEITLEILDPCVWRYVLNQDDLASFRLNVRSDVIGWGG